MKINDLIAEGKEVEYNGEKFKIRPMSVKEQAKLARLQSENVEEASKFMLVTTIQKSFPEWKEDEILSITDGKFIQLISETMLEVNGMSVKKNQPNTQ